GPSVPLRVLFSGRSPKLRCTAAPERWTESLNGGIGNLRLTLELHPDLDEVERVGGTPSDDRSNTPFNKALETHL
ncbi:unnamed protein product, partial [Vitis vinifera]